MLAPAAEWRDWIVPAEPSSTRSDRSRSLAARALRPNHSKTRATWAELFLNGDGDIVDTLLRVLVIGQRYR